MSESITVELPDTSLEVVCNGEYTPGLPQSHDSPAEYATFELESVMVNGADIYECLSDVVVGQLEASCLEEYEEHR